MKKFPKDFKKRPHPYFKKGFQFELKQYGKTVISVISGNTEYGNGIKTFEMFDFREEDVQRYLSKCQINKHLALYPLKTSFILDVRWFFVQKLAYILFILYFLKKKVMINYWNLKKKLRKRFKK